MAIATPQIGLVGKVVVAVLLGWGAWRERQLIDLRYSLLSLVALGYCRRVVRSASKASCKQPWMAWTGSFIGSKSVSRSATMNECGLA